MNVGDVVKDTADVFMGATLAKRVAGDVVKRVPYSVLGAVLLIGALTGRALQRRHTRVKRHD